MWIRGGACASALPAITQLELRTGSRDGRYSDGEGEHTWEGMVHGRVISQRRRDRYSALMQLTDLHRLNICQ